MRFRESLYYFFLIVKERQPIRALNCAHTALTGSIANAKGSASRRTLCIEDWWRMTGSNRRPPACKAGALPAELIPRRTLLPGTFTHLTADNVVGLVGFEPTTPALSRRCSNRLSYRPLSLSFLQPTSVSALTQIRGSSGKEVIQPHLPIRLPCYDFTPVMNPAVVTVLLAVRLATSGKTHSHGVTGGVYKTRERIHRGMLIRDY